MAQLWANSKLFGNVNYSTAFLLKMAQRTPKCHTQTQKSAHSEPTFMADTSQNRDPLTRLIRKSALDHGFDMVKFCPAITPTGYSQFVDWLDSGYAGEMQYMVDRKSAYEHPKSILDGVQSIAMLALSYKWEPENGSAQREGESTSERTPSTGSVSRYATGELDYHDFIFKKLKSIQRSVLAELKTEFPDRPPIKLRGVVDTAPLLEREFAQLAGIGWQGKNTLVLNRELGSLFFLAAILVDQELQYDSEDLKNHCGTCTACLDACPTDAFVSANVLDATKCISYLTIELRSPIPMELRNQMGDWVYGCDVCQDVCPWNNKAANTTDENFRPREDLSPLELCELFHLDDDQFRQRFRKTPIWRAKRRGLLRNAAIVLGNQKNENSIPSLVMGLNDSEPLVRGAAAWGLGEFSDHQAKKALKTRQLTESDPDVLAEIENSLNRT